MEYNVISADNHILEPRNLFVTRTEKGLAMQERCDRAVLAAEEAYLARLPAEERDQFVTNLTRLYQK